jgi:hypothetical protein
LVGPAFAELAVVAVFDDDPEERETTLRAAAPARATRDLRGVVAMGDLNR